MFNFNDFDVADGTYKARLDGISKLNVKPITQWFQYPLLRSFLQNKLKVIINDVTVIDVEKMSDSDEFDKYPPKLNDIIYHLIHKKVDASLLKNYQRYTEGFDLLKTINKKFKSIDSFYIVKIFNDFVHEAFVVKDRDAIEDYLEIFKYYYKDVNFSNFGGIIGFSLLGTKSLHVALSETRLLTNARGLLGTSFADAMESSNDLAARDLVEIDSGSRAKLQPNDELVQLADAKSKKKPVFVKSGLIKKSHKR